MPGLVQNLRPFCGLPIAKHIPVKIALKQNPGVEQCSTFRGLEAPLQLYASEGAGSLVNHLISDAQNSKPKALTPSADATSATSAASLSQTPHCSRGVQGLL